MRLRQIGDVVFTTLCRRRAAPHVSARAPDLSGRARGRPDRRAAIRISIELMVVPRRFGGSPDADRATSRSGDGSRRPHDLAIDFHGGPRASLLTLMSGAPRRIGYDVVGRRWMVHGRRRAAARGLFGRASLGRRTSGICSRALGIDAPPDAVQPQSRRDAGSTTRREDGRGRCAARASAGVARRRGKSPSST